MFKNVILNSKTLLQSYFGILLFVILSSSSKITPPADVFFFQCLMAIICVACMAICRKMNIGSLLFLIFIIHLLISISIRLMYIWHWNDPLGPVVFDSLDYHLDAVRYTQLSFSDFTNRYLQNQDLDDFGFTCILYCIYSLFGSDGGLHLMLPLNSLVVLFICKYLYRIGKNYVSEDSAKLAVAIVGTTAFSMTTAAKGLKENFFVLIVIAATYFLLEYRRKGDFSFLMKFILATMSLVLFRVALLPIFVFAFFSCYLQRYLNKRNIVILGILMITAVAIGMRIMNYLLIMRGLSDDTFLGHYENQYNNNSFGDITSQIINIVFGVLGAVPSFVSTQEKAQYITLPNFTLFVSLLTGSLFITGIYKILKNQHSLFPLVTITTLNILMITAMSFSFDFRYRFVTFPLIILICLYSLQNIKPSEYTTHKLYLLGVFFLIIVYNNFLG